MVGVFVCVVELAPPSVHPHNTIAGQIAELIVLDTSKSVGCVILHSNVLEYMGVAMAIATAIASYAAAARHPAWEKHVFCKCASHVGPGPRSPCCVQSSQ